MMKKILSTHSWPKFFLHHTLFGSGEHPFFKGERPIFTRKQSFHKRDTVFNSVANYFSWRVRKLRSLEPFGVLWNPGFQVVGFEPGSTE